MNRPRNRQPRPQQGQRQQGGRERGGHLSGAPRAGSSATPQQAAGTVPTTQRVVPGAEVFIVLKEDQPTGRETHGVVQELLSKGNHPRGIKVRLRGGQVGRVQRMGSGNSGGSEMNPGSVRDTQTTRGSAPFSIRYTDVRKDDDYPSEPPPRGLADYMPTMSEEQNVHGSAPGTDAAFQGVTVTCPLCEAFEGDEAAVTHHINREHLT